MEAGHFFLGGLAGVVDIEVAVEAGVDDEGVSHGYALGFHGVVFGVDELAEVGVVEVGDLAFAILQIHKSMIMTMCL